MNLLDLKDKRKNQPTSTPGYFRIGFIALDIPPEDIVTSRVTNSDEVTPLRSQYSMFVKTGQSRWDVSVSWTALASEQENGTIDYSQWEDLRYIIAMFKAAPFVEVENQHLREVFFAVDPSMEHNRMAFGLRQLRIETHNDMVNALKVTLTMTWFNYYPYTGDFGYVGTDGQSVDASQSPEFKSYLDSWMKTNMVPKSGDEDDFADGDDWANQIPGTLLMRWRRYLPISLEGIADTKALEAPAQEKQEPVKRPEEVKKAQVPSTLRELIESMGAAAQKTQIAHGIPASVTVAQGLLESGFGKSGLTRTANNWFGIKARGSEPSVTFPTKEFQDNRWITVKAQFRKFDSMEDSFAQHAEFLKQKRYRAAFTHQDDPFKFITEVWKGGYATDPAYPNKVSDIIRRYDLTRFDKINKTDVVEKPTDPSIQNGAISAKSLEKMNTDLAVQIKQYVDQLDKGGWRLDHYTEKDAFFYKEHDILLTDESNGDVQNEFSLWPQGLVVLMVNNLAQIPLASYQYPTYQHVGPSASVISFAFTSEGLYLEDVEAGTQEPIHLGIRALNAMAHNLEDQFHRMKVRWRSVRSVHRMQAVRVYNQVLNMMGVHSIMLKDVMTATLPESANMVSVQMTGSHYENVFEELGSYLIKGVKDAYKKPFLDYLQAFDVGMTDNEKKAVGQVIRYRDARKNLDLVFLNQMLLDPKVGILENVEMPISISYDDEKTLRALLDEGMPGTGKDDDAFVLAKTGEKTGVPKVAVRNIWPDYASRLKASSSMSLTDFLFLNAVAGKIRTGPSGLAFVDHGLKKEYDESLENVWNSLKKQLDKYNLGVAKIYDDVLLKSLDSDPLLSTQAQIIVNDPKFTDKVKGVGQKGSPAMDPQNSGHGAYRDMGLAELQKNGKDLNPGYYFFDHKTSFDQSIKDAIRSSIEADKKLNASKTADLSNSISSSMDMEGETFIKAIHAPDVHMSAAFPTFKLFLMEEDNSGVFYAFDDFYSFASVTDIEIIRFRDKPDVAVIQMTNLARLLSHKLFDDTVMGKHEASFEPHEVRVPITDDKGNPISGPGGIIEGSGEDRRGRNYIKVNGRNLSEGMGSGYNEVPLSYFPLQTGTKIEIRMGSSNNPDELTRVFAGTVAEMEGDELLIIRAQGFMQELMEPVADKIGTDQFWSLSTLLHFGFKKGPRFGGVKIWGDSGDTGTIMKKILECSSAKHFGHWQVLKSVDPMMKGWDWKRLTGDILTAVGGTTIGPVIASGYNRVGENVLINHIIGLDGKPEKLVNKKRDFFDQTPWWAYASWYHIPEDKLSPWEYIQDVSRRYPEYILTVKDYGFPYGCDGTLVFAHPRDSYYSRPFNYDETRNERELNKQAAETFTKWWNSVGKQDYKNTYEKALEVTPWLFSLGISSNPLVYGIAQALNSDILLDNAIRRVDAEGVTAFEDVTNKMVTRGLVAMLETINNITPNILVDEGKFQQVKAEWLALRRKWQAFRNAMHPTQFSLLRPVRKYHYVDHQAIVHNGMILNDQVFNAVRIQDSLFRLNENIPDHYTRVLEADEMIIEPEDNVEDQNLSASYAHSFLKEEVGKMYRGELVLRGMPAIEPWDVLFVTDPSTGVTGPVEVDRVIHSFNQENGYITIVTPRAFTQVNETASKEFVKRLAIGITEAHKLAYSGWNQFVAADASSQRAAFLVPAAGALSTAGAVSTLSGVSASALAAPVVSLIPAASATPPGWLAWAVIGALAAGGAAYIVSRNQEQNRILISPLMRHGKPWVGGLQGYEIGDWFRLIQKDWTNFWVDEIEPTLFSYRQIKGYLEDVR
jgi:flagellum-specific peptidoglycan hydrolase FlgJ